MAKHTESRSRLVKGCGTILKTDRLTGGYKLVKRKREAKSTTSATGSKQSSPAKVKAEKVKMASVSTPAKTSKKGKSKVNTFLKAKSKAIKSGAKSFEYGGQKYVATKTKTGMTIFKKAGKNTAKKSTTVMTTSTAKTKRRAKQKADC
jgi:hypothetical protein